MFLGAPSPEYLTVHQTVEDAVSVALQTAQPGVLIKHVDAGARKVIEQAGYGEYFVNRLIRGSRTEVHEQPYLSATSDTVLEEGTVFSIEPGIYLHEKFAVRPEDLVTLTEDGLEIQSDFQRDLSVIN